MINTFLKQWADKKDICVTDSEEDELINITIKEANDLADFIVKNYNDKHNVMERSCSNCSILQGNPKNEPTCQIQGRVIRIFNPKNELCNKHTPIKEH